MLNDPRMDALIEEVAKVKEQVQENSEIVKEIREIIGSFRLLTLAAKWVVLVGAAIAVIYSSLHGAIALLSIKK